tara:strand:- start:362 stop:649 length:288 start_codon:yes stop_codon:yes gene_type:complete
MDSQEYNEMCLHFKKLYEQKEQEIKDIKKKYLSLYKLVTSIYGLSRCFLMYGQDSNYIEDVRSICSSFLFVDLDDDDEDDMNEQAIEILNLNIQI